LQNVYKIGQVNLCILIGIPGADIRKREIIGRENLTYIVIIETHISVTYLYVVSRQEKWHSMRHGIRRGLQVFSSIQENT
jgi:hypothetical protein